MNMLLLGLGYICGSIPFGKLLGWRYGVDIQRRGSGNIGFANVRRILGWKAGLITLAGDVLKGAAPTLLAQQHGSSAWAFWTGVAAILGHVFPIWLRFRGGKGIATGLGVIIVLNPLAAAIGVVVYLIGCQIFKKSYIGSMLGLLTVCTLAITGTPSSWWHYALLLSIAIWTLRQNFFGTVPDYDV